MSFAGGDAQAHPHPTRGVGRHHDTIHISAASGVGLVYGVGTRLGGAGIPGCSSVAAMEVPVRNASVMARAVADQRP